MNKLLIVGDADSIVAQANLEDLKHKEAISIAQKLVDLKARLIYPITAVIEAVTFIQRVLGSGVVAYGTAAVFAAPQIQLIEVNQEIFNYAVKNYFSPRVSKKDTLFDCIVASVAEKYQADAIFSFDKYYKKQGFKLASEL